MRESLFIGFELGPATLELVLCTLLLLDINKKSGTIKLQTYDGLPVVIDN